MKADIYDRITSKIAAALEAGVRPWHQPWSAGHAEGRIVRPLRANGIPYRGINVLVLWSTAVSEGYASPFWLTFKQALDLGAHVRKGEKGSPVVYASSITREETNDGGDAEERTIPFLKAYTVFNATQIEGLPASYHAKPEARLDPAARIARADGFFAATGADIRHGGARAYYTEAHDRVQMPPFEAFRDAEAYYATLAHEMTHWTKHPARIGRELGRKRWGDEGYAMEELVAELGAAFLCADLDLTPEPREEHASYVASWLKVLKGDSRAIFTAAAHAQRAADYLNGLQARPEHEAAAA